MIKRLFTIRSLSCWFKLLLLSSIASAKRQTTPSAPAQAAFDKLVDHYFDFYFQFHPTAGTQAGFHQYDGKAGRFLTLGTSRRRSRD